MGLKMTDLMAPPPSPALPPPDAPVQRSFIGSRRLEVLEKTPEQKEAEKDRADRIWKALRSAL